MFNSLHDYYFIVYNNKMIGLYTIKSGGVFMYKIGQVGAKFNLSRSTLLYYDSIGILKPSCRSEANYRLYNEEDVKRLELICMYRDMGIELNAIKVLLNDKAENTEILEIALINMERI